MKEIKHTSGETYVTELQKTVEENFFYDLNCAGEGLISKQPCYIGYTITAIALIRGTN